MPKRKRVESVNNWCLGIESECDLMDKQNEEELKGIDSKLFNNSDNNNESIIESETIDNNINETVDNNNKTDCKLRRKSNRISKPIQRSLDTSPNQSLNVKKIVKQNTQSFTVSNCESEKPIVKTRSDETNKSSSSKGKSLRKIQSWTKDDTKWFFEAICEHGKDFPHIQSYMAQRCEKKGIPQDLIKNYEQVRHYYYRMWHKIANSLNISNVVDKGTQEVYGLINYGEIWKKFGSKFDSKLGLHLQQLVNFGHTIFKVKGKSVRVKTPICKALKKIHKINVSEKTKTNNNQNLLNLPKEVCIELHPANNDSWLRVHSLSQNPRLRTRMPLQKRLSTLIEYLEKRWNRSRIRDSECRTLCGTSLPNLEQTEESCLRVRPHFSGDLNNVSLSKSSFFNSQIDLSLTAYLKNLFNDELKSKEKKTKGAKTKEKSNDESIAEENIKSPNNERMNIDDENKNNNDCIDSAFKLENDNFKSDEEEPIAEAERSLTLLKMLASMNAAQNEMAEEIHATDEEDDDANKDEEERDEVPSPESNANVRLPEPPANATLAQWLSGKDEDQDHEDEGVEDDKKAQNTSESIDSNNQISLLSAERARKGWSLNETGSVTIGELYLLFRCPKKIILEYLWEPFVETASNAEEESTDESIEKSNSKEREKLIENVSKKLNNTDVLQKLLLAANVSLMNLKRSTNSVSQTQKKKRIKPTPAPLVIKECNSSQLLSSVITNTIFNDSSVVNKLTQSNEIEVQTHCLESESHNFIVPTSPAPKAVNKTKSRTVCGDPALIQEALRQLQSNKYTRRQRRPTPKPVFGQNKPLLPRGSPSSTIASVSSTQTQPIYMIDSRPLHINTITSVTSHPSITPSVLSQTLPVVANVNMTAINNNLNANSLRHMIKTHTNSETFDVILPQKAQQSDTNTQTNVVNSFIKSINSSNLPLIQNMTHILEPISPVSVPIISPSMPSLKHLQRDNSTFSLAESAPVICSKSDDLTQINKSDDQNNGNNDQNTRIASIDVNTDQHMDQVLENNANPTISSTDESSNKLPLLSSSQTISSLLEISLPEPPFSENSCSSLTDSFSIEKRPFEKLTSNQIINTNNNDPTLPTASTSSSSLPSPPIERHKLLSPVPDSQWLNGESCDLSIGTLLNACESPIKTVPVSSNSLTNDVDTQMSCLATDNSVDLMAKFADLAAQIVDSNSKST